MVKSEFGKILKQFRQKYGVSQEKLALECDLSSYYIVLLEQGKRQPSLITLLKLAAALETTPDKLIMPVWKSYRQKL